MSKEKKPDLWVIGWRAGYEWQSGNIPMPQVYINTIYWNGFDEGARFRRCELLNAK